MSNLRRRDVRSGQGLSPADMVELAAVLEAARQRAEDALHRAAETFVEAAKRIPGGHAWEVLETKMTAAGIRPPDRERVVFAYRPWIGVQLRQAVFERDGRCCVVCGAQSRLCVDHIVPISRGGLHDLSNFQTLCRVCNVRKHDRLEDAG